MDPKPPAKPKRFLTEEQKAWIVVQLAMYLTPTQVCKAFEARYGFRIERDTVWVYHPDGHKKIRKWRPLFDDARARFLEHSAAFPIADKMFRLAQLQRHYDRADEKGETRLCAELLEQAAKEMGGAYSPTRVGAQINVNVEEVTIDDKRSVLADRLGTAIAGLLAPPTDKQH